MQPVMAPSAGAAWEIVICLPNQKKSNAKITPVLMND